MAKHQTFQKLVTKDDDFVGMVAYTIYKREKINWIASFKTRHHRDPSPDEIENGFNVDTDSDERVRNYRKLAEEELNRFVDVTIGSELNDYQNSLRDEAIIKSVKTSFSSSVWSNIIAGLCSSVLVAAFGIFLWLWQVKNDPVYLEMLRKKAIEDSGLVTPTEAPKAITEQPSPR